ncbi:MAG: DUF6624 domain-containing protein, partial [Cyclobacteriaceae bacterium]
MSKYVLNKMPRYYFTLLAILISIGCYAQNGMQGSAVNYDSLKEVLERIRRTDQHARRVLLDSVGLDSPYASLYIEKLNQVDARNLKEVSAILEKYGWMGRSKIGELASDALFLVIQHSDLKTMKTWLPAFKEQVAVNEASGANYALAY